MKKRWPKAQVIALDVALPMLDQAKRQAGWWKPFQRLAADATALPLADNSVDVIFSNLCLQWVDDLPAAVQWLESQGLRFAPGGIRRGAAGHDICFVHPKGNEQFPFGGEGVLIELVQAPAEVVAVLGR